MREIFERTARSRLARLVMLGAAIGSLAGCATSYSLVQPDGAGSGSYYTSEGPYSGQGYYDYYGTGPYYPGTSGYGYYDRTGPYSGMFGWDDDYGYWPSFNFNVGISNVWGFPGYWGPWYSTGFPVWECRHWGCCHCYRDGHHHDGWHDPVTATSPHPWLNPDRAPVPPHVAREGRTASIAIPDRSVEGFARRRPLESASFAPHDFVRGPMRSPNTAYRAVGTSAKSASIPLEPHAFANRQMPVPRLAPPHDFSAPSHAAFRPAPIARPAPHGNDAPAIRIH